MYLGMLDLSPEDSQELMEKMLDLLVQRGRFDEALNIAKRARKLYRQADAPGRQVLVVENHNSFWSFGEWNHETKVYAAVVYGAGEAFRSTGAALGQVLREVEGVGAQYLGDLDIKGVRIPVEFNHSAREGSPKVAPALDWYAWLLANGTRRKRPECASSARSDADAWLGPELGTRVHHMWQAGQWIPQESLGYEQLADVGGTPT